MNLEKTLDGMFKNIIKQEINALEERITELLSEKVGVKDRVFNLIQFCNYVGCSKSHAYKLTSNRLVPFARKNGKLWFKKSEIDEWLMSKPIKTKKQINDEVSNYLIQKRKGGSYEK